MAHQHDTEGCVQDGDAIAEANRKASSLGFLAADWAFCAAVFILSDVLYLSGTPHWQISATLAGLAALNWKLFDGTKPGKCLCYSVERELAFCAAISTLMTRLVMLCRRAAGALLTVGAPAGEISVMNS